jgi:hypothetical protein
MVELQCKECGRDYLRFPSKVGSSNFCSGTCRNKACKRLDLLPLTSRQLEIVNGSLLGDASISKRSGNCCLTEDHAVRFSEYCEWLAVEYGDWFGHIGKYRPDRFPFCRISTKHHKVWTDLRIKWYPDGKKIVPSDLQLTPLTLACWHCGDGSNSKEGVIHLATHGFLISSVELLQSKLRDHLGIETTLSFHNGKYPKLTVRSAFYVKFIELVKPYIVCDCFQYKVTMTEWAENHRRNNMGGKFFDKFGVLHETENVADFAREHDLNPAHLSNVLHGHLKSHMGWTAGNGIEFTGTKYKQSPQYMKEWRQERKNGGLCERCDRSSRPNRTTCEVHANRRNKHVRD